MTLDEMTPEQRAQMKLWVDTWKRAGPELEQMREEEVRGADTARAFEIFEGMALLANRNFPPEPTSGLVEQQRWFQLSAIRQGLVKAEPEAVARLEQWREEYRKAKNETALDSARRDRDSDSRNKIGGL